MNDPENDPLGADLEALFGAERSRPSPPSSARARVLARVTASIVGAGGGPGGSGGSGAAAGGVPTGGAAMLLKPILLGLALGGALVGAVAVRDGSTATPAPRPIAETFQPASVALPAAEPVPAAPAISAAPPRPSAEPSAPAPREQSLAAERQLLDEAHRALASGRSAATFEALSRHAAEFPRGRLSEEREGLWLRALLAAGRTDEARTRAARFKRLYPRSMLLPALEEALGTIP